MPVQGCTHTVVTLPRTVTPYRDSVYGTHYVTYQKLVTRQRYGLVRCAVGIWPSHQRDDTVTAGAGLDVQRDTSPPSAVFFKRTVYKCTKPLLAAKTSLDSRNKLGTPRCNARRLLLRREARDEISARNSVSCQSFATLRRYAMRYRYKCVPAFIDF